MLGESVRRLERSPLWRRARGRAPGGAAARRQEEGEGRRMHEFVICVSLLTRIGSISQVSKRSVCTAIFFYVHQAKIDYKESKQK